MRGKGPLIKHDSRGFHFFFITTLLLGSFKAEGVSLAYWSRKVTWCNILARGNLRITGDELYSVLSLIRLLY